MSKGNHRCVSITPAHLNEWLITCRFVAVKALARVYAGWGFSQPFYREKLYETKMGFKDLEDFMVNFWEAWALSKSTCHFTHVSACH